MKPTGQIDAMVVGSGGMFKVLVRLCLYKLRYLPGYTVPSAPNFVGQRARIDKLGR